MRLLILDVDGVLTDGSKIYDASGKAVMKRYADQDFTAIKKFKDQGWKVALLSGDKNVNENMAIDRNIDFWHSRGEDGAFDKAPWLAKLCAHYEVAPKDAVYVGDDLYDLTIMEAIVEAGGTVYCPANSAPSVIEYVTKSTKGSYRGCCLRRAGGAGSIMELFHMFYPFDNVMPTCG